ncbi:MAG: hypothetical protein A3D65_03210 [Candidatus Lloydbacteria bacterium RIFCSPHIGHO2_02_FULL_50_13]|uniref:Uncharacterized protein n=1 Tax=Candidatus Lloydbacteria bacterium RIFCSPHIGHO2_02_FULL_50_13 TaxID=1798661 RepID=A0A1G2D7B4_9BACT|nr:MAG: hypothetical protein A3D65_03210 [Candidatus Lloydbacteria bacterium RIFCSPHIGHO2_02_FULL_50_13]
MNSINKLFLEHTKAFFLISFFSGIAVVLIIVGVFYLKDANKMAQLGEVYADWQVVTGQISAFTARLPGETEYATQDFPLQDSEQVMRQEMYVGSDSVLSYFVSATLYPSEISGDEEGNLREAIKGSVQAVPDGLEVFANYKVPFRGANFLEYKIYSPPTNTAYQGRAFLVGNTLYQIYASFEEEDYNDDAYTYFANSFSF